MTLKDTIRAARMRALKLYELAVLRSICRLQKKMLRRLDARDALRLKLQPEEAWFRARTGYRA